MSLGKLLATGRSLAGGPSVGRYNVSSRNRLPKFGSSKNPFAQPARPAPDAATEAPTEPAEPAVAANQAEPTPAPLVTEETQVTPFSRVDLKKTQRIPELAGPGMFRRVTVVAWSLIKKLWVSAVLTGEELWSLTVRLLSKLKRKRRKESLSVIPRFGKPAVQCELSLENVKVVCNDLEESDLEIVTAQTDTSTQVAPTVEPRMPNRGPLPPALKKLTNRLQGANHS